MADAPRERSPRGVVGRACYQTRRPLARGLVHARSKNVRLAIGADRIAVDHLSVREGVRATTMVCYRQRR